MAVHTPDSLINLALGVGTGVAALGAMWQGWRSVRTAARAENEARAAKDKAEQASRSSGRAAASSSAAEVNTRATSNGFAEEVTADLKEIKEMVQTSRRELREDLRRVEGKIDAHLEDHASADVRRRNGGQ